MPTILILLLLAGLPCAPVAAAEQGEVVTRQGHLRGAVRLDEQQVRVGDRQVPWDQVLWLRTGTDFAAYPEPNAARLVSGEIWPGTIGRVGRGGVAFRSAMLGQRNLGLAQVTALDFAPDAARAYDNGPPPPVLIVRNAEPLPGELIWASHEQVAVESPLGVLRLPRNNVVAYRFDRPSADRIPAGDRLLLVDGAGYTGQLQPGVDRMTLQHELLGELTLPAAVVRSLVRRPADVTYLADHPPQRIMQRRLIGSAAAEAMNASVRGPDAAGLRTLTLRPGMTVNYTLPDDGPRTLQALARPIDNARGSVRLRILADDREVYAGQLGPGSQPLWVRSGLSSARRLTFETEFAQGIVLPAGVVLVEPHCVNDSP